MKIDRYTFRPRNRVVKLASLLTAMTFCLTTAAQADQPASLGIETNTADAVAMQSQPQAIRLLDQVLDRIANGPAFGAKIRQRVWTSGREVKGVGIYEQSGMGTGRFHLHVSMLDGDGKHTLQQTSDGRLTWTRTVIAEEVSLKRVDVGRLDEWVRSSLNPGELSPRQKIGGWTELLDTIKRDYHLTVGRSHLQSKPVIVLSGTLKDEARKQVITEAKITDLPSLFPAHVKIAIAAEDDAELGFGKGLPVRLEFWSSPAEKSSVDADASNQGGRLITLIELYAMHRIKSPPIDRFRINTKDAVNFVNETDRYLRQYGIRLTEQERRKLLR